MKNHIFFSLGVKKKMRKACRNFVMKYSEWSLQGAGLAIFAKEKSKASVPKVFGK